MPADVSLENQKRMEWLIDNDVYDLPNHLRPDCHKKGTTYKQYMGGLIPIYLLAQLEVLCLQEEEDSPILIKQGH